MSDLTNQVISLLSLPEKKKLISLLEKNKIHYEFEKGVPDIETITDKISEYAAITKSKEFINLENSIKDKIVSIIKNIAPKSLDIHIKFLSALKKISGFSENPIHIFTTNYDLLFEMAARFSKIPIFNGFIGTIFRYFDIDRFKLRYGNVVEGTFNPFKEAYIKLIKLHGSVSWIKDRNEVFELGEYKSIGTNECSLILPRIQKKRDTLEYPYDKIFDNASKAIGFSGCLYLISCGYSFRDEHINDILITPKLRQGNIRFFALFKEEPNNIDNFRKFTNFNYLTETKKFIDGKETKITSNLWQFSQFVNLLAKKAGN